MKVCHVTSLHPANDVRIFYKECLSLAKQHEVYLIAPNVEDAVKDGVHVLGVSLPAGRLKRPFYLNRVYQKAIEADASIYHFHDPELMRLGLKLKRKGKTVIFDSHEDVPMQLLTKEYLPKWSRNTISRVYALIEKRLLAKYDALVTVTPTILERLNRINPNTIMVTNYPDYHETEQHIFGQEPHYACFAGGVDERYMHKNIIESLRHTNARYLLAGRCFIDSYFNKLKSSDMWSRVDYQGVLSPDKVQSLYSKADVGLVLLDYSPNVGYHKGSLGVLKMFEYMMAGIPVIATDFELWKEIIESYDCGICINPHDINAIAEAINYFVNNPDIARQKGENGRRAVKEKYNWATQETNLFELYQKLEGKLR